jgi:hypothetical protein
MRSHESEGMETDPISDDEVVAYTAHRRLVILAGKGAQAEQRRLEKQLRLQDGRTPRPG